MFSNCIYRKAVWITVIKLLKELLLHICIVLYLYQLEHMGQDFLWHILSHIRLSHQLNRSDFSVHSQSLKHSLSSVDLFLFRKGYKKLFNWLFMFLNKFQHATEDVLGYIWNISQWKSQCLTSIPIQFKVRPAFITEPCSHRIVSCYGPHNNWC